MLKTIKNIVRLVLKNFSFLLILFVLFANNVLRAEDAEKKFIGFVDSLEGSGDAMIRLRWNFGASFEMFDSALMVVKGGDSLVELTTKGFSESPSVDSASVQLGDGWISIDYGEVVPSVSVDVSGNVKLPKVISTRFEILKCAE